MSQAERAARKPTLCQQADVFWGQEEAGHLAAVHNGKNRGQSQGGMATLCRNSDLGLEEVEKAVGFEKGL